MAEEKKITQFQISGEDPLQAVAPIYSNFVGISRVGTDVQFEFIFLDLNVLAQILGEARTAETSDREAPERQQLVGKTVAKIVMPGVNFVQAREQIEVIMKALDEVIRAMEVRK